MKKDNAKQLQILADTITQCTKCKLCETRTKTVFSRGNPNANICIIAEAPGEQEDLTGLPLVGKSGQLLDTAIKEIGYDPEKDVYICNPIKCRPPQNRKPTAEEIQSCFPYLEEQLSLIKAPVIITLGATAMMVMTDETRGITKVRGEWLSYKNKAVKIVYHPSFILRNGGVGSKMFNQFKDDLQDAFNKSKK